MNVYVIQRGEGERSLSSNLKFVCIYKNQAEAVIFAETALEQLHAQLIVNGFYKVVKRTYDEDVVVGLVNLKTEMTMAFYVIDQVTLL